MEGTNMLTKDDLQAIQDMISTSQSQLVAYIESAVTPKFNLLADGQKNLLETLAPKSRVEALEEDVNLLKTMIRMQNEKIAELQKKIS